jgi:TonB-linked SusC/RagA family outer membrane protein
MKKRYIQILIFLSFVLYFPLTSAVAQKLKKENDRTIESVVKDEKGDPIKGAIIYGNDGSTVVKTDDSGKFTIQVPEMTDLLIESDGYESAVFKTGEFEALKEFTLKSSLFLHGEKDVVNIAFGKVKKGDLVNAVNVLNPNEILKYDNIQSVYEALSGRVPGLLGSNNIRGTGAPLFIVDGLPRNINTINLSEVEQITVLKDINSSILYGNGAVNGVVLVTTKRGKAYKKEINVTGYYGISKPMALPKFLSSADYAGLYNEARKNDGLAPQYDSTTIANYRTGNPYRYPNVNYFSDQYLKSVKPSFRVITEFSGGNDVATYYTNLGWSQTGSLLNFGEGANAKQNTFNVRGNVDMKITSWIKTSLDATAVFVNNSGPVGDYWSSAFTMRPNLFAPLVPMNLIDPNNTLVKSRKNDIDGAYLLGGTSSYITNPIANVYSGGENQNVQRTFSFNHRMDFDLRGLTKGLAFHTNISFDMYTRFDQSVTKTYSVYLPAWKATVDSISGLTKYGTDTNPGTQNVLNPYYERRSGFNGLFDYDRTFGDVHHITGSLLGYASRFKQQSDLQGSKNVNLGLRLGYSYKSKYLVDFSNAYVNSVKLPDATRRAFSPSLGLAWVMSSEEFMSAVTAINYLKLRVSGGIMNSDNGIGGYYYYDSPYIKTSGYAWDENSWSGSGVIARYGANPDLAYEKRKDFNFGFDCILLNRMLSVEANIFTSVYSDRVTRGLTVYPSFYSNYIPYINNDKTSYRGAELGLSFNKRLGDFSFVIGANGLYNDSKVVKKDEVWANSYQNRAGKPIDAIFGLVSAGFFKDQSDISGSPLQSYGTVRPGDIKYIDQDHNHIINANDQVQIGRWQAPYFYGLNLKITYKNFTLFAKGTGSIGADRVISGDYYWVDGNKKYSEIVLTRWTPATAATATYPRLSSAANPNNFQTSSFWLFRDNYFNLDRMQMTYDLPEAVTQRLRMKKLSFFVDGSSLFTISKHNGIRNLALRSEPYYRTYSIGVKTMF